MHMLMLWQLHLHKRSHIRRTISCAHAMFCWRVRRQNVVNTPAILGAHVKPYKRTHNTIVYIKHTRSHILTHTRQAPRKHHTVFYGIHHTTQPPQTRTQNPCARFARRTHKSGLLTRGALYLDAVSPCVCCVVFFSVLSALFCAGFRARFTEIQKGDIFIHTREHTLTHSRTHSIKRRHLCRVLLHTCRSFQHALHVSPHAGDI